MREPFVVDGSHVLVTGGASGIGRATALAFARRRCHVTVVDIDADNAAKVARECEEAGGSARAEPGDVTDFHRLRALADEIVHHTGAPDIVINNAGVGLTGRFLDGTVDDWTWIRGVNLDGVVHGCRVFGPAMVERGHGHIVNISSILGYTPRATESLYVLTKAAVLAFSLSLRGDWSPDGVGVSAVCPGLINTPIAQNTRYLGARGDASTRARTEKVFRRGHAPDRVARAVVKAVEQNRAVVPVGFEAHAGWWFQRFAPLAWRDRLARSTRL